MQSCAITHVRICKIVQLHTTVYIEHSWHIRIPKPHKMDLLIKEINATASTDKSLLNTDYAAYNRYYETMAAIDDELVEFSQTAYALRTKTGIRLMRMPDFKQLLAQPGRYIVLHLAEFAVASAHGHSNLLMVDKEINMVYFYDPLQVGFRTCIPTNHIYSNID